MVETQQQFDAELTTYLAAITQFISDYQALEAKISASPAAPDFTNELSQVQASLAAVQAADPATATPPTNPPA